MFVEAARAISFLKSFQSAENKFPAGGSWQLGSIFEIRKDLLGISGADPELILACLNSVLTEINSAYFAGKAKRGS